MTLPTKGIQIRPFVWITVLAGISGLLLFLSVGRERDVEVSILKTTPSSVEEKVALQIIDRSPHDATVLFYKFGEGDLWYRDQAGRDRFVASNVVRASFSPDGLKFAYGNSADELFISTTSGEPLGELTRVRDHAWFSNSLALRVSPVELDHSETEQTVVYNLEPEATGRKAE